MARQVQEVKNSDQFNAPSRDIFRPTDFSVNAPQFAPTNDFLQLANALKEVHPEIQQFTDNYLQKYQKDETEAGKAQALKSGLTYQEAVTRGIIPPDKSPFFMRAWKELDGQNQADTISSAIQQKYQTDPIRNSTNPAEFHQWLASQFSGALSGITDGDMLAGAQPKLQRFEAQMMDLQARQSSANATYGLTTAAGTQIGNQIDAYKAQVAANGGQVNAAELAGILNGPTGLAKFVGLDPKETDSLLTEAVIAKAKQYRDKSLLDVLNQDRPDFRNPNSLVPGPGKSTDGQGKLFAAGKEIDYDIIHQQNAQFELEQHKRTLETQKLSGSVFDTLYRGGAPPKADVDRLIQLDGSTAEKLQVFRLNQVKLSQEMDPIAFSKAMNDLLVNDGSGRTRVQRLTDMMVSGQFRGSPQQLEGIYKTLNDIDNSGVERVKPVALILDGIKKDGDPNSGTPPMFKDQDTKTAIASNFLQRAHQIVVANPNVDPDTLLPQLTKARDEIVDAYAKAYPGMININPDKKAHGSVDLSSTQAKPAAEPVPEKPKAELPGVAPGSQFVATPEAEVELKSSLGDPAKVEAWKKRYGMREYNRIMRTIR